MHGLSPDRQLYLLKFESEVALLETIATCENKGNTVTCRNEKAYVWLPAHGMLFLFDCLQFVK